MPKVNVYVGDELKAAMDRVGNAVNWSAVTQRGYSTAVGGEEWKMQTDEVKDAIELISKPQKRQRT